MAEKMNRGQQLEWWRSYLSWAKLLESLNGVDYERVLRVIHEGNLKEISLKFDEVDQRTPMAKKRRVFSAASLPEGCKFIRNRDKANPVTGVFAILPDKTEVFLWDVLIPRSKKRGKPRFVPNLSVDEVAKINHGIP